MTSKVLIMAKSQLKVLRIVALGAEKKKPKENPVMKEVRQRLPHLTDKERMEIFREYCLECGAHDPTCVCWKDG